MILWRRFFQRQKRFALYSTDNNGVNVKLAYKLDIYAHAPMSRDYVYIDAATGELLRKNNRIHSSNENGSGITLYNGTQNFITDSNAGTFRLYENIGVE